MLMLKCYCRGSLSQGCAPFSHPGNLVLSQNSRGYNKLSAPKRPCSTNQMSEAGPILVNFKLARGILCLVFRENITIPDCLISVAFGLCVVLLWSLMKLNSFSKTDT